ncbi:hypothetical protein HYH02_003552 [Chlamydomonas schloesseri]|uniref:Nudix hydrolase domain-containing protein n=1 Tax=Chlamydomonas schloesseri TaxID=2026947 RepID=A0A835WR14_9CHLO|nr:hypothetical protein HYH02_003552 [Chlamydomonas schloesseri]|eukprot:KAG2451773.1 hypothetical protein HYH02_003552 [Chlamydomonas schloesseri]
MAAKPGSAGGAAAVPAPPVAPTPPPVLEKKTLAESRFLRFVNVDYARPGDNAKSSWQYVERTTRRGDVDAVNIFAVLKKKDGNHLVLVVKQYRPPMGKHTIELPAGLVDKDESPQTAALRELKEETGYVGTFIGATGQQALSPGLTNENMVRPCSSVTIFAEIDPELPENKNPKQSKEDRKMGITREWLPLKNLHHTLAAFEAQGWGVFAGLYAVAHGFYLRERLGL